MNRGMPRVDVRPDVVSIRGGMNVVVSPMLAPPGCARMAYNYEWSVSGGVDRAGGIEPFDGRPAPSAALYTLLELSLIHI